MTIQNATINSSDTVNVGQNVVFDTATITGGKTQVNNGGTVTNASLSGGSTEIAVLNGGTANITTSVNTGIVNNQGGTITLAGATGGTIEQTSGTMILEGNISTATFSGGTVRAADGQTVIATASVFDSGVVSANASGTSSLTFANAQITGGTVTTGTNVSFSNNLDVNNDSVVNLGNSGTLNALTSATFGDSTFNALSGSNTINQATINGSVNTNVSSGASLTINNATLGGGSELTNNGADITVTNYAAGATIDHSAGTLATAIDLNATTLGDVTITGGTLTTDGHADRTVTNALFSGGSSTITARGRGGASWLNLNNATIDGATVKATTNAILLDTTVQNNGLLVVEDNSIIYGNTVLNSGGSLQIDTTRDPTIPETQTVTISSLSGSGGKIRMRANFNTRMGDHFTIPGDSAGTHTLAVSATGFGNDMKLIKDKLSGVTSVDKFVLASGSDVNYTEEGAFTAKEVLTFADTTDGWRNWMLSRSPMGLSSSSRTASAVSLGSLNQVIVGMNELAKRLGDLRNDASESIQGAWLRTYFRKSTINTSSKMDTRVRGFEVGYDRKIDLESSGVLFVGLMAGRIETHDMEMYEKSTANGHGAGKAPSIGAYAALLKENNWFFDGTIRHFWSELDMTSYKMDGTPVSYSPKTRNLALSAEVGKKIKVGEGRLSLEPRLQVMSVFTSTDKFATTAGNQVRYKKSMSLRGLVGLNFGYRLNKDSKIYLKPAILNEFNSKTRTIFDGTQLNSDMEGLRGVIRIGFNSRISHNGAIYMDASWESGQYFRSFGGNIGLRYTW